ncbi:39S ribosomal protein L9, mitochondrial [Leptopilina heterotoma]|uniref:39S ribosomal protein L9, mitochondrial n=1 Tax=Leptopilina heterotoma TaxID=63436 RepID=UPI001CA897AC|nr:39S ribosomal protein L9, mitochondrial [Leptopilina heterotoma]
MLNSMKNVLNCFRANENSLLECSKIIALQQKRTSYVMKRKYPVGLHKKTGPRYGEKLKHRHFIYEVIESPYDKELKPLEVILTDYVEGIGNKGEKLTLKHSIAYKLILPGLAVYASPENIEKYKDIDNESKLAFSSPYVPRTMNILMSRLVMVPMNINNPWKLERWHVHSALRSHGIICPAEAIKMPDHEISGPNIELMENKEFYIEVTINNKEKQLVRCRIHHVHKTPTLCSRLPADFYKYPAEPIFPEDKPILDSMPRHRLCKHTEPLVEMEY